VDFACTRRWRSLGDRLVSVPWPILYVEATYQAPEGSTALHHACSSSTCPAVVLTMLVELCGKAEVVQELEDEEGMSPFEMIGGEGENTPLHYFAFRSDNLECLWPLILKAPQCLVHVNRCGAREKRADRIDGRHKRATQAGDTSGRHALAKRAYLASVSH